ERQKGVVGAREEEEVLALHERLVLEGGHATAVTSGNDTTNERSVLDFRESVLRRQVAHDQAETVCREIPELGLACLPSQPPQEDVPDCWESEEGKERKELADQ